MQLFQNIVPLLPFDVRYMLRYIWTIFRVITPTDEIVSMLPSRVMLKSSFCIPSAATSTSNAHSSSLILTDGSVEREAEKLLLPN